MQNPKAALDFLVNVAAVAHVKHKNTDLAFSADEHPYCDSLATGHTKVAGYIQFAKFSLFVCRT